MNVWKWKCEGLILLRGETRANLICFDGNVALGRESCSGEGKLLWGGKVALGREVALGEGMLLGGNVALGSCSGEGILLWGGNVALGSCSGGGKLLWEGNVALGREYCSGEGKLLWGRRNCHGEKKKLSKKERIFPILGKIREILQKIEGISGDFAVEKKRFGRQ